MKNKIPYFIFIFLFCITHLSQAQTPVTDSIKTLIQTNCNTSQSPDTNCINALNALAWELKYINPDTAIVLSTQALQSAEKKAWQNGMANASRNLGVFYYLKSDYPLSLEYYSKALEIWKKLLSINNKQPSIISKKSATIGNIGNIYADQGDYTKALKYYFEALKIDEEMGKKSGIAADLGNIGGVYSDQANYQNAQKYYFEALKIGKELGDKNRIATQIGNIGIIYKKQGNYEIGRAHV